jgi:predicted cupin superfamily sugar epimerase
MFMLNSADYWIEKLELKIHPEGGYFNEVYRSNEEIEPRTFPIRYKGKRCFSTSIYFLLKEKQFSAFHKLQSDELWHFYEGSAIEIFIIDEDANLTIKKLGRNFGEDESFQLMIRRGNWFAARLLDTSGYSLIGCTVAPGFNFEDFELGKREILISQFPQHTDLIKQLTH